MTNTEQTRTFPFRCSRLYHSHGGIAEAVIRIEGRDLTGLVCVNYWNGKCLATMPGLSEEFRVGSPTYNEKYFYLVEDFRKSYRSKNKQEPTAEEIKAHVEPIMKARRENAIKEQQASTKQCYAIYGFQELKEFQVKSEQVKTEEE
jgi:hypothetical protein